MAARRAMRHGVGMEIVPAALVGWLALNVAVALLRLRAAGSRPGPVRRPVPRRSLRPERSL
jgi:hypothetical protein